MTQSATSAPVVTPAVAAPAPVEQPAASAPASSIAPADVPPADPAEPVEPAAPAEPAAPDADPADPGTTEDPPAPAAPDASAAVKPLTAFDRGMLRVLGKGDLIARLENEQSISSGLRAENADLRMRLAAAEGQLAQVPAQLAAAAAGRENQVTSAVAAELQALGIRPEDAPAVVGSAAGEDTITRAEFDALSHSERNVLMRRGVKITE